MLLLVGVLVLGILVGLALGGSLRKLSELSFHWWPLALIGLAVQFVPARTHAWAVVLLICSYALLTAFVVANIRMPGMALMAVGFVLNIVAVGANGGMPVSDHALRVAYGSGYAEQRRELVAGEGGAKHHLQRHGDELLFLTDVIPAGAPIHIIVSFGDLLTFVGAGWVVAAATLGHPATRAPMPGKHRRGSNADEAR